MNSTMRWSWLALAVTALLLVGGCAGGSAMQKVEEGYTPQYVTVGDMVAYTQGAAGMDASRLRNLIGDELEKAFREQGVKYLSRDELAGTAVSMDHIVKLDGSLTFQQGASDIVQSTDARINYQLVRASDGFLWEKGSAKSTDWSVSQGATTDVLSAIGFAAQATAADIKDLMP